MKTCRDCGEVMPCPNDCGELRYIYAQRQREIADDLRPDEGCCWGCNYKLKPEDKFGYCGPCEYEAEQAQLEAEISRLNDEDERLPFEED